MSVAIDKARDYEIPGQVNNRLDGVGEAAADPAEFTVFHLDLRVVKYGEVVSD